MAKKTVQQQFGAHAASYVTSEPHAKGASLERLLTLVDPQPAWQVLDVATGAGHTAFAFAPRVAHVWATDMTPEMLAVAAQQARERGLGNVTVEYAEAEQLPYEDGRFNLVTCRIAPHHFVDIGLFMSEAKRVLQADGVLAIVDNVVPAGSVGDYVNAFEKFRDPSHGRCLSLDEWRRAFAHAQLERLHEETLDKRINFAAWSARHDATTQRYLRAMLTESSVNAARFLQPQTIHDVTTFRLQEGIFIGRRT